MGQCVQSLTPPVYTGLAKFLLNVLQAINAPPPNTRPGGEGKEPTVIRHFYPTDKSRSTSEDR